MAIAAIVTQNVTAQKSSFGLTAGTSFSKIIFKNEGISVQSDNKLGLTFGIIGDIPISPLVSFQPGANYVQKGGKLVSQSEPGSNDEVSLRLNYIEVPLNMVYHSPGKNGHFFVGAGPSLAYGISGKAKTNNPDPGNPEETKLHFGSTAEDIAKPFEIAANILAGYQFKGGFLIAANYNFGLNNISPEASIKERTTYFGLRIGYMFAGKK